MFSFSGVADLELLIHCTSKQGINAEGRKWWEKENSLKKMGDRLGSRAPMWLLLGFRTEIYSHISSHALI